MAVWALVTIWTGCAGAQREQVAYSELDTLKLAALDTAYHRLLIKTAEKAPPDTLLPMLTDGSRDWLDTIEQAALRDSRAQLEQRPFHEIMTIVTYRLLLREHQFAGIPEYRMLRLATGQSGILQKVSRLKLGPFEVKNDRGFRGLAQSPRVPVLVFAWDDRVWKLDLVETLPLVTRGLETIGVKKDWTPSRTVLFLLDLQYKDIYRNIDETLLDPIPSI